MSEIGSEIDKLRTQIRDLELATKNNIRVLYKKIETLRFIWAILSSSSPPGGTIQLKASCRVTRRFRSCRKIIRTEKSRGPLTTSEYKVLIEDESH